MIPEKKVIVVGDERCGKTGLIFSYLSDNLPDPAVPTIYKEYKANVDVGDEKVCLLLWIAPVQEHYSEIRPLSYTETDIVILCYAIDNPASLTNVSEKWFPEIRKYLPKAPVILVGNKLDLRTDESVINRLADKSLKPVTFEQGKEVADKLNIPYFENSAKDLLGVKEVFDAAAAAVVKK